MDTDITKIITIKGLDRFKANLQLNESQAEAYDLFDLLNLVDSSLNKSAIIDAICNTDEIIDSFINCQPIKYMLTHSETVVKNMVQSEAWFNKLLSDDSMKKWFVNNPVGIAEIIKLTERSKTMESIYNETYPDEIYDVVSNSPLFRKEEQTLTLSSTNNPFCVGNTIIFIKDAYSSSTVSTGVTVTSLLSDAKIIEINGATSSSHKKFMPYKICLKGLYVKSSSAYGRLDVEVFTLIDSTTPSTLELKDRLEVNTLPAIESGNRDVSDAPDITVNDEEEIMTINDNDDAEA